jgi:hypothetical protein
MADFGKIIINITQTGFIFDFRSLWLKTEKTNAVRLYYSFRQLEAAYFSV